MERFRERSRAELGLRLKPQEGKMSNIEESRST